MSMLVSLADMKDYLGIPTLDTTYDIFLTSQITTISDSIEGYCGRVFAVTDYRQHFYFDEEIERNSKMVDLELFHFPLKTVASIEETDGTDSIALTGIRYHLPTANMKNIYGFFRNYREVVVEYSAGFDSIPTPVQDVCYSLVQERYNKKTSNINLNFGSDVQRISIPGSISVDFDYSLQANDRKIQYGMILGNYVNVLDAYRSERKVIGNLGRKYVELI